MEIFGIGAKEDPKAVCWRPKQALIECVMKTKCYREVGDIEQCIAAAECHLERKNWILCKTNVMNPRYRLRGNPYDVGTEDQKKIEARNERIAKRLAEEQGLLSANQNTTNATARNQRLLEIQLQSQNTSSSASSSQPK